MTKETIIKALRELDQELSLKGIRGEICLVGGAVMCLVFNARNSTKDLDALFQPTEVIQKAAFNVSEKLGLENSWWINDAAKAFISDKAEFISYDLGLKNLNLMTASPQYMLAMKVLSSRPGTNDECDITFLANFLQLKSKDQVMDIIKKYYPKQELSVESKIMIKSIFGK